MRYMIKKFVYTIFSFSLVNVAGAIACYLTGPNRIFQTIYVHITRDISFYVFAVIVLKNR